MLKNNLYEVVTGQIRLSHRVEFFELHRHVLLPIMREIGIRPLHLLITEVGRYGRFLDIYQYNNIEEYAELTERLLSHPSIESYYQRVGSCILGSIEVELMRDLPYASDWTPSRS